MLRQWFEEIFMWAKILDNPIMPFFIFIMFVWLLIMYIYFLFIDDE